MPSNGRPDYYALLGVPGNASLREISQAYWRLAAERRDQLPLLNEAYELLSNPRRRQEYDEQRPVTLPGAESPQQRTVPQRTKLNWYTG